MKVNWIVISIISALIGGFITYFLTSNWKISLVSSIFILVIVLLNNPSRRYMRAFYIVLFPLLSNIYFTIKSQTDNFNIQAGLKEIDITTTLILGVIAAICLLLDYLERNSKLKGELLNIEINSNKIRSSSNIHVNQTIDNKDSTKND